MDTILCLDIGSGTQDAFYYRQGMAVENCPKFILPSPAVMVSEVVERHTKRGNNIFLYGGNMGGGFSRALRSHLQAGFRAAATPEAALAVSDNQEKVAEMGVEICEKCPSGYVPVYLADFDPGYWKAFLAAAGLNYPDIILACAQDHGYHPGESNRRGRFKLWERFLTESGGDMSGLVFSSPPPEMTRLKTLTDSIGGGMVSDTGTAAVLGAFFDPVKEELAREEGACVINVGNSHIIAFLVFGDRVWGIYEHHTGLLPGEKLQKHLQLFRAGGLKNEDILADNGHGCFTLDLPREANGFPHTFVLGPRRSLLHGPDIDYPCPGGDMMLAGCFGLLKGYLQSRDTDNG